MRKIKLVEVSSEFGAGTRGSSLGMDAVRFACINKGYERFWNLPTVRIVADPRRILEPYSFPKAKRIRLILDIIEKIAKTVSQTLTAGEFPLLISGDHSNAAGTIAGIKKAWPDKRLGIVWIDAHGDLHTPYSSPSGNIHGMPLAGVLNLPYDTNAVPPSPELEKYWQQVTRIGGVTPMVNPADLVFIGIRDLEDEEWDIVEKYNIRYVEPEQLNEQGASAVADLVKKHLDACDMVYVSFDIDSLDSSLVPGTGTPSSNGLSAEQGKMLLTHFWKWDKLVTLEFSEINPLLDHRNRTAELAADLLNGLILTETI